MNAALEYEGAKSKKVEQRNNSIREPCAPNQRAYWLRNEEWNEYYNSEKMMKITETLATQQHSKYMLLCDTQRVPIQIP